MPSEPPPLQSGSKLPHSIAWPHAPVHRLAEAGTYIVTAGTYKKAHFFPEGPPLRMLHCALLELAHKHEWTLEAWAVFPNHYHFVGHSPQRADSLVTFLQELHSRTSIAINRRDGAPGRKIWFNYFETRLTHERSYFARLSYVHQNAVHHGIVPVANQYPWCSARWLELNASPSQVKTLYSFKTDRLKVPEFDLE